MTPHVLIILAFLSFLVSSLLSFSPEWRQSSYYLPCSVLAGLVSTFLWIWLVKALNDSDRLFYWSLAWDLVMIAAFYLVPLLAGMVVKPSMTAGVGLAFVLIGIILLKVGM